eukprot:10984139-Alexandrium_andersonii.AAC.1
MAASNLLYAANLKKTEIESALKSLGSFSLRGLMPPKTWDSPELARFRDSWHGAAWARLLIRVLGVNQTEKLF